MAVVVGMPMRHASRIIEVVVMPIMHVVVRQQRIPMTGMRMPTGPRTQPQGGVARPVVIAEVVVRIPRSNPEMNQQRRALDDTRWRVVVRGVPVVSTEIDRREQLAASPDSIVPISCHEQAAAGRPHPMSGHPDPVLLIRMPIAGPPAIADVVPHPTSRHPKVTVVGRRRIRTRLQRFWRCEAVRQLILLVRNPQAGDPLPVAVRIRVHPIARNPTQPRRQLAPDAANPQEIVAIVVPGPVPWNPDDVVPFRFEVGSDFRDVFRRLSWNGQPCFGILRERFGECFVNRTASQDFDVILRQRLARRSVCRRWRWRRLLSQRTQDDHRREAKTCSQTTQRLPAS